MATHIVAVTVDCADPNGLAAFWCSVLGYRIVNTGASTDGTAFVEIGPPRTTSDTSVLLFEQVSDLRAKTGKNRVHLDVAAPVGQHHAEVRRIIELGASRAEIGQQEQLPWTVLADPEGNEFCVLDRDEPSAVRG